MFSKSFKHLNLSLSRTAMQTFKNGFFGGFLFAYVTATIQMTTLRNTQLGNIAKVKKRGSFNDGVPTTTTWVFAEKD